MVLSNLSQVLIRLERHAEAALAAGAALQIDPTCVKSQRRYVLATSLMGFHMLAIKAAQRLPQTQRRILLESLADVKTASKPLDTGFPRIEVDGTAEVPPVQAETVDAWRQLGNAQVAAGKLPSAIVCYMRALRLAEPVGDLLNNCALCYLLGRSWEAVMASAPAAGLFFAPDSTKMHRAQLRWAEAAAHLGKSHLVWRVPAQLGSVVR